MQRPRRVEWKRGRRDERCTRVAQVLTFPLPALQSATDSPPSHFKVVSICPPLGHTHVHVLPLTWMLPPLQKPSEAACCEHEGPRWPLAPSVQAATTARPKMRRDTPMMVLMQGFFYSVLHARAGRCCFGYPFAAHRQHGHEASSEGVSGNY